MKEYLYNDLIYYFAYGANLNEDKLKQREVKYEKKYHGILYDYEIKFHKKSKEGTHSYADVIFQKDKEVHGFVYVMQANFLKNLDKAEGANASPPHYFKNKLPVGVCFGDYWHSIDCYVYTANRSMIDDSLNPTKEYVNYILEHEKVFKVNYVREVVRKSKLYS